jgi:hypothetical protein
MACPVAYLAHPAACFLVQQPIMLSWSLKARLTAHPAPPAPSTAYIACPAAYPARPLAYPACPPAFPGHSIGYPVVLQPICSTCSLYACRTAYLGRLICKYCTASTMYPVSAEETYTSAKS